MANYIIPDLFRRKLAISTGIQWKLGSLMRRRRIHSSARNYLGRTDYLMEVQVIDFGVQEGFIPM